MRFYSDKSGNVAIITGIVLFLLFGLGGAAVDLIRFTTLRSELQSTLDSAVLAAANQRSNSSESQQIALNFFNKNFSPERFQLERGDIDLQINVLAEPTGRTVTATATTQINTLFIKLLAGLGDSDLSTLDVSVNSEAGFGFSTLEVSLVLDVSGSMLSDGRIEELRATGTEFIDDIIATGPAGSTSLNLIPYAGNVNLGPVFENYADPGAFSSPADKPCIFYLLSDLNDQDIAGTRGVVDQSDPFVDNEVDECPLTPIILNSNDAIEVSNQISNLDPVFGSNTDTHLGLLWGLKALSPAFKTINGGDFPTRPAEYNDESALKFIILMSDGEIIPAVNLESITSRDDRAEARTFANAICDEAKDNGIIIFTIGFDISAGGTAEQSLRECATSNSHYFLVDGLNLETAFESVAVTIDNLRITM